MVKEGLIRAASVMLSIALLIIITGKGCNQKPVPKIIGHSTIEKELQGILDSAGVSGEILIYNDHDNIYLSNDSLGARNSSLPASTYKIVNSIIGLETGELLDEESIFEWDNEPRAFPIWERDLTLTDAFRRSCVPCYQDLARRIGSAKMNEWLNRLEYGDMTVNDENIGLFWLVGESRISPFEQVDFLKRLRDEKLPISDSTLEVIREIMIEDTSVTYTLRSKTGMAMSDKIEVGWYVGYLEIDDRVYYFATRIMPLTEDMTMNEFAPIRRSVTMQAFKRMKIM